MRTIQELFQVQLNRSRAARAAIIKTLDDGFITPSERRDLLKRLRLASIVEADTAHELSKLAYLK